MFKNQLVIFWRNIARQPAHSILNISCLVLGIIAVLFVVLHMNFELQYDRFHSKASQVYRINTESIKTHHKVMEVEWRTTPANLGFYTREEYPEVEAYVRVFQFWRNDPVRLRFEDKELAVEDIYAVDPGLFQVFTYNLISGNPQTALEGPNKIILSQDLAQRIFGAEDPIGKILSTSLNHRHPNNASKYTLQVTGVFQDLPRYTHLPTEALVSSTTDPQYDQYYFNRFNVLTYVLLNKETDPNQLGPRLTKIYETHLNAEREPVMVSANHALTPLVEIHMAETDGTNYVYIFGSVALLLLLIAGIGYVNLVTAQASRRSLEIGIRKVLGSHRKQLVTQFLWESLFFTLVALLLAILLVLLLITPVNDMLGLQLDGSQLRQPALLLSMVAIAIVLGILGGSYPAFFLASFKPISVLKGRLLKKAPLRRLLVAIQFAVVIFVVTCTGLIYHQLQYLLQKDLGFDQEQMVVVSLPEQTQVSKAMMFQESLAQSPHILSTGLSSFTPGTGGMRYGPISVEGSMGEDQKFAHIGWVDYDYLATMGLKMVLGRSFSLDFPSDSTQATIVNERLVSEFGLKEPIGKKVRFGDTRNPNFMTIVGVVEDFHQSALYDPIEPQMFVIRPSNQMTIKIGENKAVGIESIRSIWNKLFPDIPLTYYFMTDELNEAYQTDQIRGKIFFALAMVTVLISFLSLFGLASYLTGQRIREIGTRKVLGANLWNLLLLLTRDFLMLVLVVALPAYVATWQVIRAWLERFAFQTPISITLCALMLLLIMLLVFLTSGFHAWRIARINPAVSLKYE